MRKYFIITRIVKRIILLINALLSFKNACIRMVFKSLFCGKAAKTSFCAAMPHVQQQLRHSRNKRLRE
jgi:hypothetical protein